MARLGRGQPFPPLIQRLDLTQIQVGVFTMAGSGSTSLVGAATTNGILSAAGTGSTSLVATSGAALAPRPYVVGQAITTGAVI